MRNKDVNRSSDILKDSVTEDLYDYLFSASQFSNNCKLKIQKRQMLFPKSAK